MILCETHIAGAESLPQVCSHCGEVITLSNAEKPFTLGTRVGVVIGTAAQSFASYVAGEMDTNQGCDSRNIIVR